ncbi:Ca2+-transporting ATPase [Altererythrobacter atlanticus]|uniref:Calcium-transporting ATPase 1 n=1 Tax=Croceibacterium atlanticum TaxID=1267766 RepID=A0A0F7KXA2_9SPHN|nr:cation-transporting P-type ATPase [Croceibacterium atlanticum]AKH44319.1 Calcium-transporting ATPase 1 [Croceibacterium atlanticum]MBB5733898.1 Ca2+-transporting ATPase [Croceibacterium atlanticum]
MKREVPEERRALLRAEDPTGIGQAQAAQLAARFGTNRIAEHRARSVGEIAGDTARDPMLWFLAATSLIFALLGEWTDTVVLLLAIVPLVGMDFYLHRRTEASVQGLSSALATHARVMRDGQERQVPANELVPGDLVRVRTGEPFPADGVILAGGKLQADESSLSGEAYPVPKTPLPAGAQGDPEEQHWAFAGTRLLTGEAQVRLIFTGGDTLYGEIVRAATATRNERTPLQGDVARLVRALIVIALAICLLLAAVRLYQGHGLIDAFLSAAVLAVAAIPEEFPVVLTFFLGVGVYRLAQHKALVRRAVVVENIGRLSVICSDKTGTITEGVLRLHELRPASGITQERLLEMAAMASRPGSHDPLDEALLAEAPPAPAGSRLLASYPFTEARRREVAIWEETGQTIAVAKGAPETILQLCSLGAEERERRDGKLAAMSASGQKVIACARRNVATTAEPEGGFSFTGFIGIADPLREGVRQAVEDARQAGIQTVMVTGDHPQTAQAIAREAGLAADPVVLSGDEMEARLGQGDRAFLDSLDVVARATPAQKVLLVEAMRESGRISAVTGDGVNDVPALKTADIGIAMGRRGTQSAREVAAIVLMDDNFGTIVRAIAEGRQLFRNLTRSFAFLLMVHIPLVTTAALIPLLGYPLLYLPIHIVILELLIHPAAILGFQQLPDGLKGRRKIGKGFFDKAETAVIIGTGILVTIAVAALFIVVVGSGEPPEHARTMALICLIAALATLLAVLTGLRGRTSRTIAAAALVFSFAATLAPVPAGWLDLHPLNLPDWLTAAGTGIAASLPGLLFHAKPAGHRKSARKAG